MISVWLRTVDAGTENECWVVCAKDDPAAIEFIPIMPWHEASEKAAEAIARVKENFKIDTADLQKPTTI